MGALEIVLIGVYPVPLVFAAASFFAKWHIRHLATTGGEERYPELVRDVVEKYRRENEIGALR